MDAYAWLRIGALAVLVLVMLLYVRGQSRWRRFSVVAEVARCVLAVGALVAIAWSSQVSMNLAWAAVAVLTGLLLGYLSGRGSKFLVRQGSKAMKAGVWPALITAVGYLLVVTSVLFGTAVIISASLLVAVLGMAMTVGVAISEILRAGSVATQTA